MLVSSNNHGRDGNKWAAHSWYIYYYFYHFYYHSTILFQRNTTYRNTTTHYVCIAYVSHFDLHFSHFPITPFDVFSHGLFVDGCLCSTTEFGHQSGDLFPG